jgi:hypothetical protein
MRQLTYPPEFKYIDRSQVRSAMWRLAAAVDDLDQLMRQPEADDPQRFLRIAAILRRMDEATEELRARGRPTNHPIMSAHLEKFRQDVDLALQMVDSAQPNDFLLGTISGSCLVCHAGSN